MLRRKTKNYNVNSVFSIFAILIASLKDMEVDHEYSSKNKHEILHLLLSVDVFKWKSETFFIAIHLFSMPVMSMVIDQGP